MATGAPTLARCRMLVVVDDLAASVCLFAWSGRLATALGATVWVLIGVASAALDPLRLEEAEKALELAMEMAGLDRLGPHPLVHAGPVSEHLKAAVSELRPHVVVRSRRGGPDPNLDIAGSGEAIPAVVLVADGQPEAALVR